MDIAALIALAAGKFPIVTSVAAILGGLVVLGQVIVALTPSSSDDEAYNKVLNIPVLGALLKALAAFAPIQKK